MQEAWPEQARTEDADNIHSFTHCKGTNSSASISRHSTMDSISRHNTTTDVALHKHVVSIVNDTACFARVAYAHLCDGCKFSSMCSIGPACELGKMNSL